MNLLDIFEGREPYQQAIDRLEQRRIEDLEARMDDCASRGDVAGFQKAKAERDSYYKVKEGQVTRTATGLKHRSTDAYGGTKDEPDHLDRLDKPGTNRAEKAMGVKFDREKKYQGGLDLDEGSAQIGDIITCPGDIRGEIIADEGDRWIVRDLDSEFDDDELEFRKSDCKNYVEEAGIGQDIVNKQEKMARATPQTKAGAVASTVKNAAKWLAGKGGPGKEGPTYEGTETQWSKESDWKKVPKAKSGRPVDPRGEVTHLSDVARRKAERDAEMRSQVKADIAADRIQKKIQSVIQDRAQKKNSKEVEEGFQDFNKVEPYAVCLAGKPVKKFDYYEDARRFHDNWKAKLYREGNAAKADRITLNPIIKEFAPGGIYKPPVIPTNPGKGPFEDDPRSQTVNQVQQLLDAGKSVFVLLPGAKGRAVGTQIGDDHSWLNVQYKGWKDPKTRSRSRLTVNLKADDDASLTLTPGSQFTDNKDRPFDYTLTGSAKTSGRGLFEVTVDEADETSWTANSAQFRREEDLSWPVEITLEPKDDINRGRGAQVKTMTVSAQSRDAAKKKLVDYFRKNGWAVTGIKFTGDLAEAEDDKVRELTTMEYRHISFLAREAGIVLGGLGADKVTGDLYWSGTKDGRNVNGVVKRTVSDAEMDHEEEKYKAELEREKQRGVAEAVPVNDLLNKVTKDANKQFKKAKAGKLKSNGIDFTKGDHWTGAGPDDYGYTGYQGHGMPSDKRERDRIRADKKKGVAEEKTRLDPKCWTGKKIGTPKTKMKGGVRVNNCVPAESVEEEAKKGLYYNVNKRKAAGTSRPAGSPKAPTAQAWKDAAKTAKKESVEEEWSKKYKDSINCSNPKGFSQQAHCAGKKKNEGMFTPLEENNEARDAVESAIIRRIMVAHKDLLMKFGPQKVMDAAEAVADEHADVEEIGTSDVSAYVQQVERYLAMNY